MLTGSRHTVAMDNWSVAAVEDNNLILRFRRVSHSDSGNVLDKLRTIESKANKVSSAILTKQGRYLVKIKDKQLFKAKGFDTFCQYMNASKHVFGFGHKQAKRIMAARAVCELLSMHDVVPTSERVARPLVNRDPVHCRFIWGLVVQKSVAEGVDITCRLVEEVCAEFDAYYGIQRPRLSGAPAREDRNVFFSSTIDTWYTPAWLVDMVRILFGGCIDLDPCSDDIAQQTVKAKHFYTVQQDGLNTSNSWFGKILLNPPFTAGGSVSLQGKFVNRAVLEYTSNERVECILLILKASIGYQWIRPIWDFPFCLLHDKVGFLNPNNQTASNASNPHGSVVVFMGKTEMVSTFCSMFSVIGCVPGKTGWCASGPAVPPMHANGA